MSIVDDDEGRHDTVENADSIRKAQLRAERQLHEVNRELEHSAEELQRLAAIVESSDDAIISKTLEGIITTWNPGAERMFGYTADEAVGRSITMLIPPEHVDEEPAILARLRRGERIDHYETVRMTKTGERLDISLSVSPIKNLEGTVIGASKIARDITRQKHAEEALREADRRKDEFIATLAHELRNPLAPIRHAAAISKAENATEAQKRWSHDVISRQVQHMALLLEDLLDVSRITRGTLELRIEMTELAEVLDAAIETARPSIEAKRHKLTVDVPEEPVWFAADPLRLAQVLANLLTNASKYTDAGGKIQLHASSDDTAVTISVRDNGMGIPRAALGKVFEMFAQVHANDDRADGGLGIGLALTKGLMELHGGTIEAQSPGPGKGSEFTVRLPMRKLAKTASAPVRDRAVRAVAPRRVLIADDNHDAAEGLAVLLRMDGHEVTVVHDGLQALRAFESEAPDVALLDIGMPKLNGYELARRLRNTDRGRSVTLVAVTGWGQDSDKTNALAAGFDHHFTKPLEPDRLTALLRSI
jgi:PAS domain S-box-containing protein